MTCVVIFPFQGSYNIVNLCGNILLLDFFFSPWIFFSVVGVEFGARLLGRVWRTEVDGILSAACGAGEIFFFLFDIFFLKREYTRGACAFCVGVYSGSW